MKSSNFENFVRGKVFLYIYILKGGILGMKRTVWGCIPDFEDTRGWFCRKHLSYKRLQPLHTPHNVVDYIPTPILT